MSKIPALISLSLSLLFFAQLCTVSGYSLNYNYTNLDRQVVNFSQYEGTLLLVEGFWTTCQPCVLQHPVLGELDDYYSSNELDILSLSILDIDSIDEIQNYVEDRENEGYSTTWDIGKDNSGSIAVGENLEFVPTMILYDENGGELYRWIGLTPLNNFTDVIDDYLSNISERDSTTQLFLPNFEGLRSLISNLFGSPIFQGSMIAIIGLPTTYGLIRYSLKAKKVAGLVFTPQIEKIISPLLYDQPKLVYYFITGVVDKREVETQFYQELPTEIFRFKAMMHPVRIAILKLLGETTYMSTVELKDLLGLSWTELNNNLKAMKKLNQISMSKEFIDDRAIQTIKIHPATEVEFKQFCLVLGEFLESTGNFQVYVNAADESSFRQ